MAAMVPMSLTMRRSGPGVSGATLRPYSLAKARTSLTALGSAPWLWRYCACVRRTWPVRLALRGFLRRTRTETVIFVPDGAGFSPVAGDNGAFSLPGSTVRGDAEMWGVDCFVDFFLAVLAVMGGLQIW